MPSAKIQGGGGKCTSKGGQPHIKGGERQFQGGGQIINHSFVNEHFLLRTYFLTIQIYKRMRLITRVYGRGCKCNYFHSMGS